MYYGNAPIRRRTLDGSRAASIFSRVSPRYARRRTLGGSTYNYATAGAGAALSIASVPAIGAALGLSTGLVAALPIVGAIALPLMGLIGMVLGQHAQKVAQEANTLNGAVPAFATALQAIFQAANQGQISQQQALNYIDEAVSTYYQQVGSIMKKSGTCTLRSDCSYPGGSQPGNVDFSPCNGPCSVGCNFIEPSACLAKNVLTYGGSASTPSLPSHAGFQGQPSISLSYQPPAPPAPVIQPALQSSSTVPSAQGAASGVPLANASGNYILTDLDQQVATPLGSFSLFSILLASAGALFILRR